MTEHEPTDDSLASRAMDADLEDAKEPSIAHFAGGATERRAP